MQVTLTRAAMLTALALGALALTAPVSAQTKPAAAPAAADAWKTLTELSKVDFTGLGAAQKTVALEIMRTTGCGCGCGMKIAECRVKDKNCPVSPGLAAKIVSLAKEGKNKGAIAAELAKTKKPAKPAAKQQPPATLADAVEIPISGAPSKGPKNAKVTIIEFSDFECPFCSRAIPWVESLLKAYPKDVRVVFKQYPLPFHKNAKRAAAAALAANEQGKFWPMHDKLFANFRTLTRANIDGWAKEIGLDTTKFAAAMDSGKFDKVIESDMAHGSKAGVRGTPSFFFNGRKYNGGRSVDASKPIIDALIAGKPIPAAAVQAKAKPTPAPTLGSAVEIALAGAPVKGPAKAKVTIVEFSDFECPYCSRAIPWVESILKAYPKDVKVVFKQYPLPFHKNAKRAASAALAAHEQGKFWPMHDKLFANFRTLTRPNIDGWAKELGLDMTKFAAAMDSKKVASIIDKDMADGKKAGVRGTPSFYVNGKKYNGGRSLDAIKPIIDQELKGTTKSARK